MDGTAKIWDAASGQGLLTLRVTLSGYKGQVNSVSFSPDGKRLATGSGDKTVKIWDAASGKVLLTLLAVGHASGVSTVCFSPDGKRLATSPYSRGGPFPISGEDKTAKIWDAASGRELLTLRGHEGAVWSICFSPDGKRLATASNDKTAKIWDAANGQELLTLHTGGGCSVCFSPDGKRLATAGWDDAARIWDAASGQELLTLAVTLGRSIAFVSARTTSGRRPAATTTRRKSGTRPAPSGTAHPPRAYKQCQWRLLQPGRQTAGDRQRRQHRQDLGLNTVGSPRPQARWLSAQQPAKVATQAPYPTKARHGPSDPEKLCRIQWTSATVRSLSARYLPRLTGQGQSPSSRGRGSAARRCRAGKRHNFFFPWVQSSHCESRPSNRDGSRRHPRGLVEEPVDPMAVLRVFGCLRMKEGLTLRAYVFSVTSLGTGHVVAMPSGAAFPQPDSAWGNPSRPKGSLGNAMDGVVGDGSPWSYLCALIVSRELAELRPLARLQLDNAHADRRQSTGVEGAACLAASRPRRRRLRQGPAPFGRSEGLDMAGAETEPVAAIGACWPRRRYRWSSTPTARWAKRQSTGTPTPTGRDATRPSRNG